ncbi:MAG: sulfite exporter TauE/SafE family protein [Alphaproteobacteria bacterium]
MTVELALLVSAIAFGAAIVSGLAGFAFALVAAGAFLQFLPPVTAVALTLFCSLLAQIVSLVRLHGSFAWRRALPMIVGGVIATPLGTWLLTVLPGPAFRLAIGVFLVVYSLWLLLSLPLGSIRTQHWAASFATGTVGGAMGGIAGLSGPAPILWCQLHGWSKDESRAIYQPFITVMQTVSFAALALSGGVHRTDWPLIAIASPLVIVGSLIGLALYKRVDEAQFRRIVLILLLASGLSLLIQRFV